MRPTSASRMSCRLLLSALCLAVAPAPVVHAPRQGGGPIGTGAQLVGRDANPAFRPVSDEGCPLPDTAGMQELAERDPITFLENCLLRYRREVKGYSALLVKHERIEGKLYDPELVEVSFREQPHSVRMKWLDGARKASAVVYVQGENEDRLLVLPDSGYLKKRFPWAGRFAQNTTVKRELHDPEVRGSSRFTLPEFGIRYGMERSLACWSKARDQHTLHIDYLGSRPITEVGGRTCHVFHRYHYNPPEEDIADLVLYIDVQNWLQVGSVLRGQNGELIAEYYFRELKLNPAFPADHFTRQGMMR